jgi:hypothetical protein
MVKVAKSEGRLGLKGWEDHELQRAQTAVLQKYWEDARNVYSLIGGGRILSQVSDFSGKILQFQLNKWYNNS